MILKVNSLWNIIILRSEVIQDEKYSHILENVTIYQLILLKQFL